MNKLALKVPPALIVVIGMLLMKLLDWLFPAARLALPGTSWLYWLIAGIAVLLFVLSIAEFRRHRTTVDPVHPDAASALVTSGIFSYSRNPMYVGFALILLAWAVKLSNPVGLVVLPLYMFYLNRFQIRPEERILLDKFGSVYADYMQRVRRWL